MRDLTDLRVSGFHPELASQSTRSSGGTAYGSGWMISWASLAT
jgi:hypothetical protein